MPLPESTQAATLSFDAAVHRALSRRLADTPYPHAGSTAAFAPVTAVDDDVAGTAHGTAVPDASAEAFALASPA